MTRDEIFIETAVTMSFRVQRLLNDGLDQNVATRLQYHRILMVERGVGRLSVDERRFEVSGSSVFLLAKGQLYCLDEGTVISGYLVSFGDCFWERAPASASNCKAVLFNNAAANQCLSLSAAETSEFVMLFKILLAEFEKADYVNKPDAMAALLKVIMIKLANVRNVDESTADSPDYMLYRKFLDLLSREFKNHREVAEYARLLGVTSRRLSDVCKRCSNQSPKEIITGQLIAEAKRLLQFSAAAVKEIAYQLSFNSPEQFSSFFKKNTQISPANYKDQFLRLTSG